MIAQENINGVRVIRAFSTTEDEQRKFDVANADFRDANLRQVRLWSKYHIGLYLVGALPHFFVLVTGSVFVITGAMSIGSYVAVGSYIGFIINPITNLSSFIMSIRQMFTCANRIFTFLETGVTIKSKENPVIVSGDRADIRFEHVNLTINSKKILEDITIDLPQGKSLGIVGPTGCGKTMLCNLLCRFIDPVSGNITINGVCYTDAELHSLRRMFSYVPQEVFLFSETIQKNIALYDPDIPFEKVEQAARTAQAEEFIQKLPEGYDTIVGERGIGLSGGQKQRISIARALVKDSPVMIFDDSSSALDTETEKKLITALYTSLAGKTKVIVTHKLTSVKNCDEIIVLDNGRIIERGTHDELLMLGGKYAQTYREQVSAIEVA